MDAAHLMLVTLITAKLREKGYRYLAETDDNGDLVIRIFKGLDES